MEFWGSAYEISGRWYLRKDTRKGEVKICEADYRKYLDMRDSGIRKKMVLKMRLVTKIVGICRKKYKRNCMELNNFLLEYICLLTIKLCKLLSNNKSIKSSLQ